MSLHLLLMWFVSCLSSVLLSFFLLYLYRFRSQFSVVGSVLFTETEELKPVPAPVLLTKAEAEAHNVSHLPFRGWCSACVRGRGLSLGHRKFDMKTKEAEQIPTVSVDYAFFGQTEDRAHDTLPVRDRKSKGIWSHPVPSKGVTHLYLEAALMTDLDFRGYLRVMLKSDQVPSIVALCDAVKNGLARRDCA